MAQTRTPHHNTESQIGLFRPDQSTSIVMAEAVLIDVDNFLINQGVQHTRYVDDFRIFGNSIEQMRRVQQDVTLYFYETHRLTLSGAKTYIMDAERYVERKLHDPYVEEKVELLKSIEVFNPYTQDIEEVEIFVVDDRELLVARLNHIINRILEYETLDLGLARSAIRRARQHEVAEFAELIINNIESFAPVISDVAMYLSAVTDDNFAGIWRQKFGDIVSSHLMNINLFRFWIEWYLSMYPEYRSERRIRKALRDTPYFVNRARTALEERDLAWTRAHKARLHQLGSWERRALLNTGRILPSDERNHWLRLTKGGTPVLIDQLMAKWVRETS